MGLRRTLTACAVVVAFVPLYAAADDEVDARSRFQEGTEALHAGELVRAETILRESLSLHPHPATAFNLVVALRGLGRAVDATAVCEPLLAGEHGVIDGRQRDEAAAICDELRRRIATVEVIAAGAPEITVRIDGEPVATVGDGEPLERPLDPGAHVFAADAPAHEGDERELDLSPGEVARLSLRVVPLPVTSPSDDGVGVGWWIAGGAAAAAITAAIVIAVVLSADPDPVEGDLPVTATLWDQSTE